MMLSILPITIFMGTNDYGYDTVLGSINDSSDISFYGALNVIIPALKAKYPNAKIVFVTPIHRYGYGINSAGHRLIADYLNHCLIELYEETVE